jgi:hypothetical protein
MMSNLIILAQIEPQPFPLSRFHIVEALAKRDGTYEHELTGDTFETFELAKAFVDQQNVPDYESEHVKTMRRTFLDPVLSAMHD